VVVRCRGPQRLRAGGIPGGVYDRSGLPVCVCCSLARFTSAGTVGRGFLSDGSSACSSAEDSQSLALCVLCSWVVQRHCTPLCTLAGLLEVGSRRGERSAGGLQKGEVGRRTRMSHVARNSFGGLVSLGGDNSSGVSLHFVGAGSDSDCTVAGSATVFLVCGGSLVIYYLWYL